MVEGTDWKTMKTAIYSSASQVLGSTSRKRRNWFDENDIEIKTRLKKRRQFHRTHENNLNLDEKKPISLSAEMSKKSSELCKTLASTKKLARFKVLRTDMKNAFL